MLVGDREAAMLAVSESDTTAVSGRAGCIVPHVGKEILENLQLRPGRH